MTGGSKTPHFRLRFTLRLLLVATAIVAVGTWWATRQLRVANALRAQGATLTYKYEYDNWNDVDRYSHSPPTHPPLLVRLFGPDIGSTIVKVSSAPESDPTNMAELAAQLPELRLLSIQDCELRDRDLEPLVRLTMLKGLYLRGTAITDEAVSTFVQLKQLHVLNIDNTSLSDEALQELRVQLPGKKIHANKYAGNDPFFG